MPEAGVGLGGCRGWCRQGERRLAAGQNPPRHRCGTGVMGEPGVAGGCARLGNGVGQTLLEQPAAPLGLSAVTALETQLSDLAQKQPLSAPILD